MQRDALLAELERLIASEEAHRREIDQILERLKSLRSEVAQTEGADIPRAGSGESKTQFQKVVEFFCARDNQPQTMDAIVEATGIPKGSLAQVLYRTHRESFVTGPALGQSKRRVWALTVTTFRQAQGLVQLDLFGQVGDFTGISAKECCYRLLKERGNRPMNALTLARAALRRGYSGGAQGSEDDVLMTTAKSFWARLGRDERFIEVRPQVFVLRGGAGEPPVTPTSRQDEERSIENQTGGQE
jgi:hypothetical protein